MKHYATRGLSLVCAAALVLSGCNASSSQTVEPTVIGESGTLACVGDSITFGAGILRCCKHCWGTPGRWKTSGIPAAP